jgi:hypothetical protein
MLPTFRFTAASGLVGRFLTAASVTLAVLLPTGTARAQTCTFSFGFATLYNAIPTVVGNCIQNVQYDPVTGDGLQVTTNGLLVWTKSDNVSSFTDGFQTWIDGPFGLQMRLNSQVFAWEPNPDSLAITPPPVPGDQCHTAGTSLSLLGSDAGAGNIFGTFGLTNELDVPCTFFGFVGAQLLDANDNPLPTVVVRDGGAFAGQPGPTLITVPPSGLAQFQMHWTQVPTGAEVSCPTAASLAVIPPDEFVPLALPVTISACNGGELDVTAVQQPGGGL